ncbi:hypothetical protein Bca52824_016455 [Brassica carinata]|uniref:Uncharacterized protein n=1 Tax=Brassica carinata TaxID=52824 RepID=A0A8X8B6J6_BRACI|nr:hypothetical protein Bca52824_016455 [Brassica carinata]
MTDDISFLILSVARLGKEIEEMKMAHVRKRDECMMNVVVCGVGMVILCYYYLFVKKSESEWHEASSKAKCIAAKMDLLDDIIRAKGDFDFVAELEKLTAEHMEAEGNLADVKIKVPDWFKLGEKWMMDE